MPKDAPDRRSIGVAAFHILLALSTEPLHGYGILKEIDGMSGGQFRIGPGTLYDNLPRLIDRGFVEDLGSGRKSDPRRMYRLTRVGEAVLLQELDLMAEVVRVGRRRLGRPKLAEGR